MLVFFQALGDNFQPSSSFTHLYIYIYGSFVVDLIVSTTGEFEDIRTVNFSVLNVSHLLIFPTCQSVSDRVFLTLCQHHPAVIQ